MAAARSQPNQNQQMGPLVTSSRAQVVFNICKQNEKKLIEQERQYQQQQQLLNCLQTKSMAPVLRTKTYSKKTKDKRETF